MRSLYPVVIYLLALTMANCQDVANNDAPEMQVLDREDVDWKLSEEGNATEGGDDYYDDEETSNVGDESVLLFADVAEDVDYDDSYDEGESIMPDIPATVEDFNEMNGYDDDYDNNDYDL